MDTTIFLSYNWNNETIADAIESYFKDTPITIKRDKRDLHFKQSIKEFMKQIRKTDYALMIISEDYLKSSNCMYEVLEFIKDENYKDRIIPIILKTANIFSPEGKLAYLNYWNNKHTELQKSLEGQNPENCTALYLDLKHYSKIKAEISEFLTVLSDMNSLVIDSLITSENFTTIRKYLGIDKFELKQYVLQIEKKSADQDIYEIEPFLKNDKIINYEFINTTKYTATILLKLFTDITLFSEEIKKNIISLNFILYDFFDYEDSYYILSMRKTLETKSTLTLWWNPFAKGYTNNLENAGIFSSAKVKKEMNYGDEFQKDDFIGIPKRIYDETIKIPTLPYEPDYLNLVEDLSKDIIGTINWEWKSFYHRPWSEIDNEDSED
ncbi:MAG: toll/interleukin-1 receptor domain-containing protein [Treponema sp.]|nr:toll/interleukin-1 receptor domain-containing protein [Treponema sp.]